MQLNPYLIFNGQCEEAFKFYEKCLGGKIEAILTFGDSPMAGQVPAEWGSKVMHARMNIDGMILMVATPLLAVIKERRMVFPSRSR